MEKMIKIGNIGIYEKLCTGDFYVESELGQKALTHGELYKLLDSCDKWKVNNNTSGFITFWHGKIEITAFLIEKPTRAYINPQLVENVRQSNDFSC